jgi:uncharacterized protein (TIGR02266 family)
VDTNTKGDNPGAEKRQHRRSPILLKVAYRNAQDFLIDYTENISAGGMFIITEEAFEVGNVLDFEISFPGLLSPIPIKGMVKWCRPASSPDEPAGIGVQFIMEDTASQGPLSTLVARLNQPEPVEPTTPQPLAEAAGTVFRVLLVEDNMVVRDMFRYGIQKLTRKKNFPHIHLEVEEADNGKEAWELLKTRPFHLLILDLYMPVMDGHQLIQYVRMDPLLRSIPIIVVSSGSREDRKKATALGADIFLSKPVKLKEIIDTVETLISTGHILKAPEAPPTT